MNLLYTYMRLRGVDMDVYMCVMSVRTVCMCVGECLTMGHEGLALNAK